MGPYFTRGGGSARSEFFKNWSNATIADCCAFHGIVLGALHLVLDLSGELHLVLDN